MNKISLSVLVPAYNEEGNIEEAVKGVVREIKDHVLDYEIIIINDGSTDNTGKIAKKLSLNNRKIKVIDRKENKGFGYSIKEGITEAKKGYITQFHGDNDAHTEIIIKFINSINEADLLTAYQSNFSKRTITRRFFSKIFINLMNAIFGLNLKYLNGLFICRTKLLKSIKLTSKGFAIYAEAKVRIIKSGYTYREIPYKYLGRKSGQSKAMNAYSVVHTFETILSLVKDVYILRQ